MTDNISIRNIFHGDVTISPIKSSRTRCQINAEEIRQYLYCPRIVYWRRIADIRGTTTYLMNVGGRYHESRNHHIYQRKGVVITHRNTWYFDSKHQFGGKLDQCLEYEDRLVAVEFKRFFHKRRPPQSHIFQAMVGGLAAESFIGKTFTEIEIQFYQGKKYRIPVTEEMRVKTLDLIRSVQQMIVTQNLPNPTKDKGKCVDCEYKKICYKV